LDLRRDRPDRRPASSIPATKPATEGAAMTTRRPSPSQREGRFLGELERGLRPVARPNIFVVLWRWRYELALLAGLPAAIIVLISQLGSLWTSTEIAVIAAMLAVWPEARCWLYAHARCVITTHRVRTGCAQTWIHTRHGRLPIILLTSPKPFGERVHIWCRAGTCLEDFESARYILRSACWARDIYAVSSARYSHIVILEVIRRETIGRGQAG
jgi:hypothetical protein